MPCNMRLEMQLVEGLNPSEVEQMVRSSPGWVEVGAGVWQHLAFGRVEIRPGRVSCQDPAAVKQELISWKIQQAARRYGWQTQRNGNKLTIRR